MKRISLFMLAIGIHRIDFSSALGAQGIASAWQGSLQASGAGIRTGIKNERSENGTLKGMFYAIKQTNEGLGFPPSRGEELGFTISELRKSLDVGRGRGMTSAVSLTVVHRMFVELQRGKVLARRIDA